MVRLNRVPEKVLDKVPGGFGAEPRRPELLVVRTSP